MKDVLINYICTIINHDTSEEEFLVLDIDDLSKLTTNIDSDRFRLINVEVLVGPFSRNVFDYLKRDTNLEYGKK